MIEIVQSPTIISVQQQLDFLEPQYVRTILWASGLLVVYSLYHFFTVPKLESWKDARTVITFYSHTVGMIMSIYLFVISLVYFYGGI